MSKEEEQIQENIDILNDSLENITNAIKLLNDKQVTVNLRIKGATGTTHKMDLLPCDLNKTQVNFEVMEINRSVSLIPKKQW